jgi:hypothetical protein
MARFPFAFLLLQPPFGIMRDFAGQALPGFGNETVVLRNQSVPQSLSFVGTQPLAWFLPYFSQKINL